MTSVVFYTKSLGMMCQGTFRCAGKLDEKTALDYYDI